MFDYKMEHICTYTAELNPEYEVVGETAEGLRIHLLITGGQAVGPKIKGTLRPVGADWFIVRRDGVGLLDVRSTIETHDGALIYNQYSGVTDLGADGYERFLSGDIPPITQLRAASRMSTGHPDYMWLNRLQCINIGKGDQVVSTASYDVYAFT